MKIGAAQISGVLRDPGRFAGVLLHGEDAGLIRDRALAMTRRIVPALDDPFLSCILVRQEHARLLEEARSLSMVGGRRVVRVLEAGDALAGVAGQLNAAADGALVILEAGTLTARSKLRLAAEKAAAWASIACYGETGPGLAAEIRRVIGSAGCSITDDAIVFLARELGTDTATRRSELEKLVLFASGKREITLDMAASCCARVTEPSMDVVLAAVMKGEVSEVGRLLLHVVEEGATGASLIIAFIGRVQRVLRVRLEIEAGRDAEEAVRSLRPPVFFRDVATLVREAQRWSEAALMRLLADARSADTACKRAGSRDTTVACQLMMAASRRGSRPNRVTGDLGGQ